MVATTTCPGCRLEMPASGRDYDRKFNASAECWAAFEDVLAAEFQDPALFAAVHQMTVDTYAVQHAGGRHPDKSVCVHLVGLLLALERGLPPTRVSPLLQRLTRRKSWPHLEPPDVPAHVTVLDVRRATSPDVHAERVREWANSVWASWRAHHDVARELAAGSRPGG